MYLKKIEIQGFKSFADKTTIHFDGGVTAIVGPNGCGKSNVSDSIRWVLGERSAKMLRGHEMQDLIFSGTEYRKAVGLAEISLTFDNSKKLFPVEYEELVITRRLYRSGESEYLINKTPCRYKDIQSLILDTGVGSSAYSMIEQGRIDYIVSAKPDERRFLIEEAAGISKYKVNKEEAIRKLQHTEENLIRIQDIVVEIERNIKYAEKQAKRAEKYKLQFDELKELEIVKALREQNDIHSKKQNVHELKETLGASLKLIQAQLQEVNEKIIGIDHEINVFDNSFSLVEEKRYFLKSELATLRDQMQFKQEKNPRINTYNTSL
jgi:chromosome segregation protein